MGLLLTFWGAPSVFAQTGHFILISQGNLEASSTLGSSGSTAVWDVEIGSGFIGTSTGAFMTGTFTKIGSYVYQVASITVQAYSDSAYTSPVSGFTCNFANPAGAPTVSPPPTFLQLDLITAGGACNHPEFVPAYYYKIELRFQQNAATVQDTTFYGISGVPFGWTVATSGTPGTGSVAVPQFAIVADGFQIVPTAAQSGVSLSGAQAFCNSTFGTSTAGFAGIGTDITNGACQIVTFMFIPSSQAVQNFADERTNLALRVPFSYFGSLQAILNALTASSSDNFINLYIPFGTTTAPVGISGDLGIISTTTVSKYLPDPIRLAFRGLIAVAFYLLAFSFIYQSIKHIWNKPVG